MKIANKTGIAVAVSAVLFSVSSVASATETSPLTSVGASYSSTKFKANGDNVKPGVYGVFVNYGNKYTGDDGYVYQAGVDYSKGSKNGKQVENYKAYGDLGYRFTLTEGTYADLMTGVSYNKHRDFGAKYETPTVKVGLGMNQKFNSENTGRIEVGYDYAFNGEVKANGNKTDIKDRANPYVEVGLLNTSTGRPITASIYYQQNRIKSDEGIGKYDRDETGFRVAMGF